MQGTQQRETKERGARDEQFRKDQAKREADQFKAQLDETVRQHDLENSRLEAAANFAKSVQQMQQQAQLSEIYSSTGTAPGAKVTTPTFSAPRKEESGAVNAPIAQDLTRIPSGQARIDSPFGTFNAVTPEQKARITAMQNEIAQGPILERQSALALQSQNAAKELENLRLRNAKDIKEMEISSERIKEDKAHSNRLAEISLQNTGRTEAAKVRNNSRLQVPFTPQVQRDEFGLDTYDPTLTPDKAQSLGLSKPLTVAQKDKIVALNDIQLKTLELKNLLETKDKDGIEFYNQYYTNAAKGIYKEAKGKLTGLDSKTEKVRRLAADIELMSKNTLAKLGGALTPNEQQLLEKSSPSPDFGLTPTRAKEIVNGFYDGLVQSQSELAKQTKTGAKLPKIIRHDKDGNVIN